MCLSLFFNKVAAVVTSPFCGHPSPRCHFLSLICGTNLDAIFNSLYLTIMCDSKKLSLSCVKINPQKMDKLIALQIKLPVFNIIGK